MQEIDFYLVDAFSDKTFGGNEDFLRSHGVEVVIADDPQCLSMMEYFIKTYPDIWNEDIMVD